MISAKRIINRFLITTAVMILVVIPFLSAALTVQATKDKIKEPQYLTEKEALELGTKFWFDHKEEVIEYAKPLLDFIQNPASAPEILEKELGLGPLN